MTVDDGDAAISISDFFRAATVILVSVILVMNLLALILSFGPVLEKSPDTYISGLEGSISLPYLPAGPEDFSLDFRDEVQRGEEIRFTVRSESGEVPDLPLTITITSSSGDQTDRILHDGFTDEGQWFAWTLVQMDMEPGKYDILLNYRSETGKIPIGDSGKDLEVAYAERPYAVTEDEDDIIDGSLMKVTVRGPGSEEVTSLFMETSEGDRFELEKDRNGTFSLELNSSGLNGWKRVSFFSDIGNTSLGERSLRFHPGNGSIGEIERIAITQPLRGYDELYRQSQQNISILEKEEVDLFTSTYYRADLYLSSNQQAADLDDGIPEFPSPMPEMYAEGRRYSFRPIKDEGMGPSHRCYFRTPKEYNDHPMDGLVFGFWPVVDGSGSTRSDLVLKERQSPSMEIDPDPYLLNGSIPDRYDIVLKEGWELVSYRKFEEKDVNISYNGVRVNGSHEEPGSGTGASFRYEASVEAPAEPGQGDLEIVSQTRFRMDVWISFIFFSIPEPVTGDGIPVWFTLISVSIAVSLFFVAWRSFGQWSGRTRKKGNLLDGGDTDITILAKTFVGAYFFSWAIYFMFQILEQPTPVPGILSEQTPIWIRMILLAEASVWEEIVARVMFIGLPLLILGSYREKGWDRIRILLGGQGSFKTPEMVMILVSSSFFGLAHLGWGPWKVIPTFVTGALFGYLYIKVGLHAAIAMHFLFDYNDFIYEITGISRYPLLAFAYLAILVGGFYLAELLARSKWWLEERTETRIAPLWMLVMHSLISVSIAVFLLISSGDNPYSYILISVPLLESGAFLIHRSGYGSVSKVLVSVAGLLTLALAPLAMIWIYDADHGEGFLSPFKGFAPKESL